MTIFQLFFAIIALIFLVNSFAKYFKRQRSQTFFKLLANTIVWTGIFLFAIFPKASHSLSMQLGFGESLNTFIFIGFLLVFMILFKIISIIERIERNISEIVRKEALSKIEKCNNLKNNN